MSGEEVRVHKSRPYGVPVAVAIVVFAFVLLLYKFPSFQERTTIEFNTWVTIGNLVILAMLCILAIWKITLSTDVDDERRPGRM